MFKRLGSTVSDIVPAAFRAFVITALVLLIVGIVCLVVGLYFWLA